MTTQDERKRLYFLYVELKSRRKVAEQQMNDNYQRPFSQMMDEDEYEKQERIREANYRAAQAIRSTLDSMWTLIKSQYSNWEIELAIQEGEGRIGELKYQ